MSTLSQANLCALALRPCALTNHNGLIYTDNVLNVASIDVFVIGCFGWNYRVYSDAESFTISNAFHINR